MGIYGKVNDLFHKSSKRLEKFIQQAHSVGEESDLEAVLEPILTRLWKSSDNSREALENDLKGDIRRLESGLRKSNYGALNVLSGLCVVHRLLLEGPEQLHDLSCLRGALRLMIEVCENTLKHPNESFSASVNDNSKRVLTLAGGYALLLREKIEILKEHESVTAGDWCPPNEMGKHNLYIFDFFETRVSASDALQAVDSESPDLVRREADCRLPSGLSFFKRLATYGQTLKLLTDRLTGLLNSKILPIAIRQDLYTVMYMETRCLHRLLLSLLVAVTLQQIVPQCDENRFHEFVKKYPPPNHLLDDQQVWRLLRDQCTERRFALIRKLTNVVDAELCSCQYHMIGGESWLMRSLLMIMRSDINPFYFPPSEQTLAPNDLYLCLLRLTTCTAKHSFVRINDILQIAGQIESHMDSVVSVLRAAYSVDLSPDLRITDVEATSSTAAVAGIAQVSSLDKELGAGSVDENREFFDTASSTRALLTVYVDTEFQPITGCRVLPLLGIDVHSAKCKWRRRWGGSNTPSQKAMMHKAHRFIKPGLLPDRRLLSAILSELTCYLASVKNAQYKMLNHQRGILDNRIAAKAACPVDLLHPASDSSSDRDKCEVVRDRGVRNDHTPRTPLSNGTPISTNPLYNLPVKTQPVAHHARVASNPGSSSRSHSPFQQAEVLAAHTPAPNIPLTVSPLAVHAGHYAPSRSVTPPRQRSALADRITRASIGVRRESQGRRRPSVCRPPSPAPSSRSTQAPVSGHRPSKAQPLNQGPPASHRRSSPERQQSRPISYRQQQTQRPVERPPSQQQARPQARPSQTRPQSQHQAPLGDQGHARRPSQPIKQAQQTKRPSVVQIKQDYPKPSPIYHQQNVPQIVPQVVPQGIQIVQHRPSPLMMAQPTLIHQYPNGRQVAMYPQQIVHVRPTGPQPNRPAPQHPGGSTGLLSDYEIKSEEINISQKIGHGATATVYKGSWQGTDVAVKMFNERSIKETRGDLLQELLILFKVRHPNLVLIMGTVLSRSPSPTGATMLSPKAFVTEFCGGGTLFSLLHRKNALKLTWKQRIKIARDVAQGCCYLHTFNPPIVHRDLKSLNILLATPVLTHEDVPLAKISDFGMSAWKGASSYGGALHGLAGTYHWMAPEVTLGRAYGEAVDVYSYGIILYELGSDTLPYQELSYLEPHVIGRVVAVEGRRPELGKLRGDCPKELRDLMTRCWSHEPVNRPTFQQIIQVLDTLRR